MNHINQISKVVRPDYNWTLWFERIRSAWKNLKSAIMGSELEQILTIKV